MCKMQNMKTTVDRNEILRETEVASKKKLLKGIYAKIDKAF